MSTVEVTRDEVAGAGVTGAGVSSAQTADAGVDRGKDLVEELLVEEISIDGMCGVY